MELHLACKHQHASARRELTRLSKLRPAVRSGYGSADQSSSEIDRYNSSRAGAALIVARFKVACPHLTPSISCCAPIKEDSVSSEPPQMLCLNVCRKSGLKSLSSQAAVGTSHWKRESVGARWMHVCTGLGQLHESGARAGLELSRYLYGNRKERPARISFEKVILPFCHTSYYVIHLLYNDGLIAASNANGISAASKEDGSMGMLDCLRPLAKPNMTMLTSLFCCSASFLSPSSRHRLLRYRITNVGGADPFWLSQLSGHRCTYHSNHSTTFLTHCKADRAVPKLPWLQHIFKSWPLLQFINYRPGRRPPHLHKLLL